MSSASWRQRTSFDARSRTPHDNAWVAPCHILDELAQTSQAVIQFFLGQHKFLCCTPTLIPVGTESVVGIVRFSFHLDGLLAHTLQSTPRHEDLDGCCVRQWQCQGYRGCASVSQVLPMPCACRREAGRPQKSGPPSQPLLPRTWPSQVQDCSGPASSFD